jgi:hypothetical protein
LAYKHALGQLFLWYGQELSRANVEAALLARLVKGEGAQRALCSVSQLPTSDVDALVSAFAPITTAFAQRYFNVHEIVALKLSGARLAQDTDGGGNDDDDDDPIARTRWPHMQAPLGDRDAYLAPVEPHVRALLSCSEPPDGLWGAADSRLVGTPDEWLLLQQLVFVDSAWAVAHAQLPPGVADLFSDAQRAPEIVAALAGTSDAARRAHLARLDSAARTRLRKLCYLSMLQAYFVPPALQPPRESDPDAVAENAAETSENTSEVLEPTANGLATNNQTQSSDEETKPADEEESTRSDDTMPEQACEAPRFEVSQVVRPASDDPGTPPQ